MREALKNDLEAPILYGAKKSEIGKKLCASDVGVKQ